MRDYDFNKSASPSISLYWLIAKAVSMALKFMVAHDAVIHRWCNWLARPKLFCVNP